MQSPVKKLFFRSRKSRLFSPPVQRMHPRYIPGVGGNPTQRYSASRRKAALAKPVRVRPSPARPNVSAPLRQHTSRFVMNDSTLWIWVVKLLPTIAGVSAHLQLELTDNYKAMHKNIQGFYSRLGWSWNLHIWWNMYKFAPWSFTSTLHIPAHPSLPLSTASRRTDGGLLLIGQRRTQVMITLLSVVCMSATDGIEDELFIHNECFKAPYFHLSSLKTSLCAHVNNDFNQNNRPI